MISDARFGSRDARVKNFRELDAIIGGWTSSLSSQGILSKLHAAEIPAAEVRDARTAMHDPRLIARHDVMPLIHPKYGSEDGSSQAYGMGMPIKFSAAHADFDQAPPALGQHNPEVYGGILGYDDEKLTELKAKGVI